MERRYEAAEDGRRRVREICQNELVVRRCRYNVLLTGQTVLFAQNSPQIPIDNANCVATDALGRKLPSYQEVGEPKPNRKHLMMLSDVGVDFLFLDHTNGRVYEEELEQFLAVAEDLSHAWPSF